MTSSSSQTRLVNALAHEFVERIRQGGRPTIEEYSRQNPSVAEEIRELFPTLILVERLGSRLEPEGRRSTEIPTQVGEFIILREIARGGMGIVYEAIQQSLGRRVALKVLPLTDASNEMQLARFRREAQAVAQLHHTNIVPVFGIGEDRGLHFYAMQFIEGQTLDHVLRELRKLNPWNCSDLQEFSQVTPEVTATLVDGLLADDLVSVGGEIVEHRDLFHEEHSSNSTARRLNEAREMSSHRSLARSGHGHASHSEYFRSVARIGIEVAEALAYAHGQGVLHRDIKPANLLLDTHGIVWISDFGLARLEGHDELTVAGDVVGTLRYIPPERFQGQTDERGDIYGLGLTLYELLTLQPAFADADRALLVSMILQSQLTPLRELAPQIPRDLETIVRKAISRDPADRYQTARSMAEDLRRFVADQPIRARRTSAIERTWRWCRTNRALAALTGLSTLLLVGITVLSLFASMEFRRQLEQTRYAQRQSRERRVATLLAQSRALRLTARAGQRFETLRVLREATQISRELQMSSETFRDLRSEYIAALCLPDVEAAESLLSLPAGAVVDFDPSFRRYAIGGPDGNVELYRVAGRESLASLPGPGIPVTDYGGVVFSPDGRFLQQLCATRDGRQSHLRLWDLAAGKPKRVLDLPGARWAVFLPDSRQIAVKLPADSAANVPGLQLPMPAELRSFDTATGRELALLDRADDLASFAFHPTEPLLAVTGADTVRIIDLHSATEIDRWQIPGQSFPGWDDQGRRFAVTSDTDLLIHRWDTVTHQRLSPLEGHRSKGVVYGFSHGGNLIASNDGSGFLRLWDAHSGRLLLAAAGGERTTKMRFSPNDRLISGVNQKGVMRLMRVASGAELRHFEFSKPPKPQAGFPRAIVSPDGRLLAATAEDATVIFDLVAGEQTTTIPGVRVPLLFDSPRSLLTHAVLPEGVSRWVLKTDPTDARRMQVGPPEQLIARNQFEEHVADISFGGMESWSASKNGSVIAMPEYSRGAHLFVAPTAVARREARPKYVERQLVTTTDVRYCAVSPDGQWVVTGSHLMPGSVSVWDVGSGRPARELLSDRGVPLFSPDGHWLAVVSNDSPTGGRLWKTGSWTPGPILELGHLAFSPDSQLMAVTTGLSTLQLLVPDTGEEVARMIIADPTRLKPECFTPDGNQLVAFGLENGQLYVWDLHDPSAARAPGTRLVAELII